MEAIKLYLGNKTQVSPLRFSVYQEDLERVNETSPLKENEVKIDKSYIMKNEDKLEVGFFIRNASSEKIGFEDLTLILKSKKGEIVGKKEFVFDKSEPIPAMSAVPYFIEFKLSDITSYDENEEYDIMFVGVENLSFIRKAELEIEGIEQMGYEAEQIIKGFMKELPTLAEGDIDINPFRILKTPEENIKIIIIIRNGNEAAIQLEQLPVALYLNNELVNKKVVNAKGNVIPAKKAKLLTVIFSKEEADIPTSELANVQVLIQ